MSEKHLRRATWGAHVELMFKTPTPFAPVFTRTHAWVDPESHVLHMPHPMRHMWLPHFALGLPHEPPSLAHAPTLHLTYLVLQPMHHVGLPHVSSDCLSAALHLGLSASPAYIIHSNCLARNFNDTSITITYCSSFQLSKHLNK
jgi:hypothetical protein